MKIKRLWLNKFKNLKNFQIEFDDNLTSVIIGGNGTGKSNLLEAIAIIFRDLDLGRTDLEFEYYLKYVCKGQMIEVDANPSQSRASDWEQERLFDDGEEITNKRRRSKLLFRVNGEDIPQGQFFANKSSYLPTHVFGYYSGPTNRLAQHFEPHQKKFYDEQRAGVDNPLRPLFFALPVHSQFVLLAYFSFPDEEALAFLRDYLGITDFESVMFVIKQPDWARAKDRGDLFWGATGIPRQLLQDLYDAALAPTRTKINRQTATGKHGEVEILNLYIKDIETLRYVASSRGTNQNFFKALDTLYIARMIDEVRIRVKRIGIEDYITFPELSEGEQQLLTVLGLMKFTRDSESLFLLDEPDTHLNPAWKLEYMGLIEPVVGVDTNCQILLATHDPIVIGSCVKSQVRVLYFDNNDRANPIRWLEPERDPRGMGPAALLTSDIYGLRSALDVGTQQKLDRKRHLAGKPSRSQEEESELQELAADLWDLEYTNTIRDPMYELFVRAMSKVVEANHQLMKNVLSKEEQEFQEQLAEQIARSLKHKGEGVESE